MKKYLLVGGAENVGKTGAICRLTKYLFTCKGFHKIVKAVDTDGKDISKDFINQIIITSQDQKDEQDNKVKYKDFRAILNNDEERYIAINSATDKTKLIQGFQAFIEKNKDKNISIIISSIRDINVPRKKKLRQCFLDKLNISEKDIDIELPLAKIKGPEVDLQISQKQKDIALKWYEDKIDKMLQKLVEGLLDCQNRK
jgi:hypothetical protein